MAVNIIEVGDKLISGEVSPDDIKTFKKDELLLILAYVIGITRGATKAFKR